MGKKVIPIVVIVFVVAIIGFLMKGLGGNTSLASTQPGDSAVDFELSDVNGNIYTLASFEGKPVVLNFFATWCQPCIDEAPELEKFGLDYDGAQLIIIAKGESKKRIEKYISESDSKLLYLLDTKEDTSDEYGVIGQPETVIIDQNGVIVERFTGPTTKKNLIQLVEEKTSL